jgi:hypothetical protein
MRKTAAVGSRMVTGHVTDAGRDVRQVTAGGIATAAQDGGLYEGIPILHSSDRRCDLRYA